MFGADISQALLPFPPRQHLLIIPNNSRLPEILASRSPDHFSFASTSPGAMPPSSTPTTSTTPDNATSGGARKRKRNGTSVDLSTTALDTVQYNVARSAAILKDQGVAEDDEDLVHLESYSYKLLIVKAYQIDGYDVMALNFQAIPFSRLGIEHFPRLNIIYDKTAIIPALEFRTLIVEAIQGAFFDLEIDLKRPIQNLQEKMARNHRRVNMQASGRYPRRRFHVNQAVSDVMDYCEDVLKDHCFCVLPELALARRSKAPSKVSNDVPKKESSKAAGKKREKASSKARGKEQKEKEKAGQFGFSIEGRIMTEESANATKCVTFLTGVADYALWTFGMNEDDVSHQSLSTVRYMKILSSPDMEEDIDGHIVAVESKRQLNTPGEIDAAIAQAAGECLVMETAVPFVVTSGLKWIFGVLNRIGVADECETFALRHSGVLDIAPELTAVGHDEAYKAVFESLLFWPPDCPTGRERATNI
ncbi:hypothetical protein HWV62_41499 [Athelia sp. TMB]|nr:hypothetical protein HWV62_41499 [Athelia sp. TMB]